jgi:hypothetical protein
VCFGALALWGALALLLCSGIRGMPYAGVLVCLPRCTGVLACAVLAPRSGPLPISGIKFKVCRSQTPQQTPACNRRASSWLASWRIPWTATKTQDAARLPFSYKKIQLSLYACTVDAEGGRINCI